MTTTPTTTTTTTEATTVTITTSKSTVKLSNASAIVSGSPELTSQSMTSVPIHVANTSVSVHVVPGMFLSFNFLNSLLHSPYF